MTDKTVSSLIIDIRQGERLFVDGGVEVELLHKSGQLARLRVTAPRDVRIRKEKGDGTQPECVASMAG